ncbi:MAG: tRNA (adenosine(37)-N6)-threonylcarbamoyltransferase complex dimerization subunit type 1 TsaB [Oligoflexia bacterium]|nr:tRNA (adenosine(37)-N6)-threonylcarbamoyltransferase complex dimerization subunit type 1 TsaB [Oligoflexia bacterium]
MSIKLLGWDTSSKAGAIVALEWDQPDSEWPDVRLVGEWSLNVDSKHSERLLWGIHQVLESARWKLSDVDLFSVGTGPGSFTGLRIGVTTARTLAHSMSKPLIGVSSLAALARPASLWLASQKALEATTVIAATDAAKGELFALWGKAKAVSRSFAPEYLEGAQKGVREAVMDPSELVAELVASVAAKSDGYWLAVGEGRHRYPEAWKKLSEKKRIEPPAPFYDQVQGRYLGMISFEAWKAGFAASPLAVHPRYLRASDAEVKLKAGLLKPQNFSM